jgi:hypothetical protein
MLRHASAAAARLHARACATARAAASLASPSQQPRTWLGRPATVAGLAAVAALGATGGLQPATAASGRKTSNEPLAPRHRVSVVAGVLRNAVWEGDPRCRDLPTLLRHLKSSGYDGSETSVGDLIMCFYQDKTPDEAIPIIVEEFRRAGLRPTGANCKHCLRVPPSLIGRFSHHTANGRVVPQTL